jgi:citronellyl-CoA synthetase
MSRTLLRAARMPRLRGELRDSIGHRLTEAARRAPRRTALLDEHDSLTWAGLDERANRVAHHLIARGVRRGEGVAILLDNRIDLLASILGTAKAGAVAGLVNVNQRGDVLRHSLGLIEPRAVLLGAEHQDRLAEVGDAVADLPTLWFADPAAPELPRPAHADDAAEVLPAAEAAAPAVLRDLTLGDPCLYIFTSGTTGLPKAAIVTHERFLRGMYGYGNVCLDVQPEDRIYNCLPLYHSTGLVIGFGSALFAAATMIVRRRFSASALLRDVRETDANVFVYVGELCRYLAAQPRRHDDARNPLRKIIGNGLRPDIWKAFKERFGIERVLEIYGASEGNSGFVNAFNKDCTIGFGVSPHEVVEFDPETAEVRRDERGRCIPVRKGEPGLLLMEIGAKTGFDGYTSREATEKKIVRDVRRAGDAYFNTGDLVRAVDVGFAFGQTHYQFVDRLGDTFRWRGENCSTNEVGEVLNRFPQVDTANVYGVEVPEADGRAGMAAIRFDPEQVRTAGDVDWKGLARHVDELLAPYARPVFVRVHQDLDTTATFKLRKTELREAGFDPANAEGDAVYVRRPGSDAYEPLEGAFLEEVRAGTARL